MDTLWIIYGKLTIWIIGNPWHPPSTSRRPSQHEACGPAHWGDQQQKTPWGFVVSPKTREKNADLSEKKIGFLLEKEKPWLIQQTCWFVRQEWCLYPETWWNCVCDEMAWGVIFCGWLSTILESDGGTVTSWLHYFKLGSPCLRITGLYLPLWTIWLRQLGLWNS